MFVDRSRRAPRPFIIAILVVLSLTAGCRGHRSIPTPEPTNTPVATAVPSPTPATFATPIPIRPPAGQDIQPAATVDLTRDSFRYEVKISAAGDITDTGAADTAGTVISGQYRAGAWQQKARSGGAPGQETLVVSGNTYTRPAGEAIWTRWQGVSFDDAYGLASPFTVLRLYSLAPPLERGDMELVPGASEATFRREAVIPAAEVRDVLEAGVKATATTTETQTSLAAGISSMAITQTVTYWVGQSGRIYRAAATLVAATATGETAPWAEVVWHFWDWDNEQIAVTAPAEAGVVFNSTPATEPQPAPAATRAVTGTFDLAVHVFASPGAGASDAAVTVYVAGDAAQPLAWQSDPEARFDLPAGTYDVRVQTGYAEEWLQGVAVTPGTETSQDVTFDFGTLQLSALRDGAPAAVEIVTYPAGDRRNWVDWRSDNPATIPLRAGTYDLEIAYDDFNATETVTGLAIVAGEVTTRTVELKP